MDYGIEDLIIPVDGSDHAEAAVRFAVRLSRATGADLHLAHAFPGSVQALMERIGTQPDHTSTERMTAEAFEALRNGSARRALQRARQQLDPDQTASEHVLDGDPAEAISAFIGDGHGVQVVMGRRGLGRVRELLVGSVSERVIHRVPGPVTVVTAGHDGGETDAGHPEPLVVPVDGSDAACRAAAHAATVARCTGARIHLLHAFPGSPQEVPLLSGDLGGSADVGPFAEEAFAQLGNDSAREAFDSARDTMADTGATGLDIVEVRRRGEPAHAVLDYLREVGPAEIIIGRRGLGRVQELLVGSVSQKLLHGARCPVTVIG